MEKIDILLFNRARRSWVYECTTHADTLKEAKARYLATVGRGLDAGQVKAEFTDSAERRERLEKRVRAGLNEAGKHYYKGGLNDAD